jgi:Mg-chelatase subunit ChlD
MIREQQFLSTFRKNIYLLLLIFSFCIPQLLIAQVKFDKTAINYGSLENWSRQPAEFYFTNTSTEKLAILRIDASDEVHARYPANFILPGQSSRIVVYYEPLEPGNFSEEIRVYTNLSKKPVVLNISGKVASVVECPSNDNNEYVKPSYRQEGIVLDKADKEPVEGASIKFIDAKKYMNKKKSSNSGGFDKQLERGIFTVIIDAPGYNIYAEEIYLDKNSAPLVFLLEKSDNTPDTGKTILPVQPEAPKQDVKTLANTLEGIVIDSKTKQAVFQAGVNMQNTDTRINYYYLTWCDGKFSKQLRPGTYLLNIVAKNYEHFQDTVIVTGSSKPMIFEINPLQTIKDTLGKVKGSNNPLYFVVEGMVSDKASGIPVANAKIRFYDRYNVPSVYTTYKDGKFRKELQKGPYTVVIKVKNYQNYKQQLYVGNDTNNIIFPLEKPVIQPDVQLQAVQKDTATSVKKDKPVLFLTEAKPIDSIEISMQDERTSQEMPAGKLPDKVSELDRSIYVANNIVFLIDVSGSMKENNKMELLKTSMKNVTGILRDIDHVSIITYASKQKVVLPGVRGSEKGMITEAIDSLKPHGFTYGMEGLQKAWDQSKQAFVVNGNNQVILVTDGMFNSPDYSESQIISLVKKMKKENITISVIGFGKEDEGIKTMKKITKNGGGNYLLINNREASESVLVKEIMSNSKRKLNK